MILAPASPDAFKPIVRAQILPATIRAYPAVSDGFVYIRNENTLVCLDLSNPSDGKQANRGSRLGTRGSKRKTPKSSGSGLISKLPAVRQPG